VRIPPCELPSGGRGPHQIENRREVNLDVDGFAFDFITEDCAGLVERHKEFFADDVIEADINARDGLRLINDAPELKASVGLRRCSRRPKAYLVIAEDLEGVHPALKACLGVSHNDGAASVGRNEADGLD